jgi:hypothetical protein
MTNFLLQRTNFTFTLHKTVLCINHLNCWLWAKPQKEIFLFMTLPLVVYKQTAGFVGREISQLPCGNTVDVRENDEHNGKGNILQTNKLTEYINQTERKRLRAWVLYLY